MIRVVSFLLTFLSILLITTPTTSNVSKIKEPHYWKPLIFNNTKYSPNDLDCLAKNIYFEAGVESTAGKLAVANVTINRILSNDYPNTVCKVVKEGKHYFSARTDTWEPFRDMCQFPWYCDGRGDDPNPGRTWNSAKDLAKIVLEKHHQDILIDITDGATHYHANWMEVFPRWSERRKVLVSIDRHIFYGSIKRF